MTQTTEKPAPRPFTGWHMLATICAFFAVVITANVTMAVFATGSWTGLVVENSYVASQKYNAVLSDARTQAEMGWSSKLDHSTDGFTFTLQTRASRPVAGARVVASLSRPIGTEMDRTVDLTEREPGVYRSDSALEPGAWNVEITATAPDGTSYRQIYRLRVRAKG